MAKALNNDVNTDGKSKKTDIAEQEKAKKEREKKLAARLKKEQKRINKVISYPSKLIIEIAIVLFIMTFVIFYYGNSANLVHSIYRSFLVITVFAVALSSVLIGIIVLIAEFKKKDNIEKKAMEENFKREEEQRKMMERMKIEEEIRQSDIRRIDEMRRFRENNDSQSRNFSGDGLGTINLPDDMERFNQNSPLFQQVPA